MDLDHLNLFENSRKKKNFQNRISRNKGKKIGFPKNCRKKNQEE